MTEAPDLSVLKRNPREPVKPAQEPGVPQPGAPIPPPRRRWSTRVLIPGAILVSALGILAYTGRGALRSAVPIRVVPAIMQTGVQSASGGVVAQAPGWVEPDPFSIAVTGLTDGIVQEVLLLEGQPVRKGQVVARLVADDARLALERAEAELRERQSELKRAQALALEAQRTWDNPVELERKVATTQAMLAERRAELVQLPADIESAKARLGEMDDALDRIIKVRAASQGAIAEQELIRAQKQRDAQRATLESTEARRAIIQAQIDQLQAEVKAAQRTLELRIPDRRALEEAQAGVASAQAVVQRAVAMRDEAKLRLDRMEVRSPADGILMARLVQPGSKLMLNANEPTGAQVARLYDPEHLQVRVDVALADAAKVHVGQAAEVVVSTLPDRVFRGTVSRVVHEADIAKNTLQFKVAVHEPSAQIKPEMLARVKFLAPVTSRPATSVSLFAPTGSIFEHRGNSAVWLHDQTKNLAEMRHVTLGSARLDGWIEVREGLRPGDWLIVDPPADLKEGSAVRVIGEMNETPTHTGHTQGAKP
jgi:RND family efflux transporter MFP subunit